MKLLARRRISGEIHEQCRHRQIGLRAQELMKPVDGVRADEDVHAIVGQEP